MKFLYTLISILVFNTSYAQSFYDINTVQKIEIHFDQTNWDYILDTATAGGENFTMAKWVKINGIQFDSVGVKYKGNSSYKANQVKNPFHIALDNFKNQDYFGYTDIKLSNCFKDPSMIREVLSYKILRKYMHAPQSNFAEVYVNDVLIGLYSSSESISKKFVKEHFYSKDNAFFKCNPIYGSGPSAKSNLVYLGKDSSLYYQGYELKSGKGWQDLVDLCDTLSNKTSAIEKILDVDRAFWMLAFDNIFVNIDSYIGAITQNYYLYRDDNKRFNTTVWDLNESFGTFTNTGTGNLNTTADKQQLNPLLHLNDTQWPLVQKLLNIPIYKRMYIAHMRTMLNENFSSSDYVTEAQNLQVIIDANVKADINKFYSYDQFKTNVTSDIGTGMQSIAGIKNLMDGRYTFLSNNAEFKLVPPSITNVVPNNALPDLNSSVTILATVNNATSVYIGYRYSTKDVFIKSLMFDDGLHNDGIAGDGIFGFNVIMSSNSVQYYIYAENSVAGIFSPERAEFEFFTLNAKLGNIQAGEVVINEFLAINDSLIADTDGKYDDWIELFNNTNNSFSLDDVYLSDSYKSPLKWHFPANTIIGPKSYLIIWADDDSIQMGLHAYFKLSGGGEKLILSYANGYVIDSIDYSNQISNLSFRRCPNGTGHFEYGIPTFNAINCNESATTEIVAGGLSVFPNPTLGSLTIKALANFQSIKLYNELGQLVNENNRLNTNEYHLQIDKEQPGVYFLKVDQYRPIKVIKLNK